MKPKKIAYMSYVPFRIELMFNDTTLSTATAFSYLLDEKRYLLTNWHNVTGRHPDDFTPLSPSGGLPNRMILELPIIEPVSQGVVNLKWVKRSLSLYEDPDHLRAVWWEHPEHGPMVDAAAIEIEMGFEGTATKAANDTSLALDLVSFDIGMDVFVLGYPKGVTGGGRFPIWKRGSIASEPEVDLDGLPKLYIDTATREGMSGAPVYAQASGFWAHEGKSMLTDGVFGKGYRFLGIYSGRVGDDAFKSQLGKVWKEEALTRIIAAQHAGKSSWELSPKSSQN